jgi:hypothetical protein
MGTPAIMGSQPPLIPPQGPPQPPPSAQVLASPDASQMPQQAMPTTGATAAAGMGPAPAPQVQGPNKWHQAVHALLGTSTTYDQTPNGPVPRQVENKPGQLFRSILAGAILGGAAGAENSQNDAGSGWSAAGRGAGAARQGQMQQQQQAQQQAQKQFENQQAANKEAREAQSAATEDQLRKAEIAHYNIAKLGELQAIQGGSYSAHKGYVADAKPVVDAYNASGLKPVRENIAESDHDQWIKDHPGDATLDWQPVGMKSYKDADGNMNYETVWDAYDPKGPITITPSMWSDWKDSGLLDHRPDLVAVLKPDVNGNRTLPYSAFSNLTQQNTQLKTQQQADKGQAFQDKKNTLELTELNARIAQARAATAASGDEALIRKQELQDRATKKSALEKLTQNGGDWALADPSKKDDAKTHLTPDEVIALQPEIEQQLSEVTSELKSDSPLAKIMDDPTSSQADKQNAQDQFKGLWERRDQLNKLRIGAPKTSAVAPGNEGIPSGAMVAVNPTTKEKRYSTDGGKTWVPVGAPAPAVPELPPTRGGAAVQKAIESQAPEATTPYFSGPM